MIRFVSAFDDILTGLDDLPWAQMEHAYGPAHEVPAILRNLIDPDPATREYALDAMYGGVHHQGDVYDSTLASIPFLLRIAVTTGLPGRADVVELLGSIGGAGEDFDEYEFGVEDEDGMLYSEANALIAAEHATWISLLSDVDPRVREAAAGVLPACRDGVEESVPALIHAAGQEADAAARAAYIEILGRLSRICGSASAADYLSGILAADPSPRARIAALSEVVRLGVAVPAALAVELLTQVYAESTDPVEPAGFETDTLIGSVRRMREEQHRDRRSPQAEKLVSDVVDSFGDRLAERRALVTALLQAADWESRFDVLSPVARLIDGWRGDYTRIVGLVGAQLADPHPALRPRALMVLSHAGPLAAPAADPLAAILAASPREAPASDLATVSPAMVRWADGRTSIGAAVSVLADVRDVRVLPTLAWLIDHDEMPPNSPYLAADFGTDAAPLLPVIRGQADRMADDDDRKFGVLRALRAIGAPAEEVAERLLRLPASSLVARFLGELAQGGPQLREWIEAGDRPLAGAAAQALARLGGDPAPVLAFVDRFAAADEGALRDALTALALLGPAGRPGLDVAVSAMDNADSWWWTPLRAAEAVWRITGETAAPIAVLRDAWEHNSHTRPHIAALCTETAEIAEPLRDLLVTELGAIRRHNARPSAWSDTTVAEDEQLLHRCRASIG